MTNLGCSDKDDNGADIIHDLDVSAYDYAMNSFVSFRDDANEDGKNVVPIKDLITAWNGRPVEFPTWT